MEDYEKRYEEFWKDIVENPDGSLNMDQVKRELSDYYFMMNEVPKVYSHITGGLLSKPNYYAAGVINAAEDHYQEELEAAIEEEKQYFICTECEKSFEDREED